MAKMFSPGRLVEARTTKGWKQRDLAHSLRTGEKNIWRWENGINVPRAETVAEFATQLERSIEFFYVDNGVNVDAARTEVLRAEAKKITAPLNDDMVKALFEECGSHIERQKARPVPVWQGTSA